MYSYKSINTELLQLGVLFKSPANRVPVLNIEFPELSIIRFITFPESPAIDISDALVYGSNSNYWKFKGERESPF